MPDEMFFTSDERSLRRGKRRAARTETCRPCVIQTRDGITKQFEGVVLDMNAHGLRIRAIEPVPVGTEVTVQLMRDDTFQEPFSRPLDGAVVRREADPEGFMDHGIRLKEPTVRRPEPRPVETRRSTPPPARGRTKMHTLDVTIGDEKRFGAKRR